MDECFSEIQVNDKVYYFNTKLQERSGTALMRGPAGWVVVIEDGNTVVVNEGDNYCGHTEGKKRVKDHLGEFLNGQACKVLPTSGLTDMVETVPGSTM